MGTLQSLNVLKKQGKIAKANAAKYKYNDANSWMRRKRNLKISAPMMTAFSDSASSFIMKKKT